MNLINYVLKSLDVNTVGHYYNNYNYYGIQKYTERSNFFFLEPNNDSALNADAAKFWNKEGLFRTLSCH